MKKLLLLTVITIIFLGILTVCSQNSGTDKTLISWVKIVDPSIAGGSIITVQSGDEFDGIVFGEVEKGKWLAGSDNWKRSDVDTNSIKIFEAADGSLIQMAIVYEDNEIRIYRNGELYSSHRAENIDLLSREDNFVVFGVRHMGGEGFVSAEIEDARIYDKALTVDQLKSLKPNEPSDIEPYAWWDFESEDPNEKTGSYEVNLLLEQDDAEIRDGRLVLRKWGAFVSLPEYVEETPKWPENPPQNWVTFHLAHPGPGIGDPGDPNPAYFYKGRYHLHYIYRNNYGFAYAHVSSRDMVHWKWHKTVLTPPVTGHGMFSGTGFYTEDGTPAMIYHGQGSGRNMIAYALDDSLDKWTKPEPIEPLDENGNPPEMYHWDPDIWRIDDTWFALSGGKDPELIKSPDLKEWSHVGKLLHEDYPDDLGVIREEDISCANMFKIGGKWMLLCISHQLGCRYYLGDFKDGKYLPEEHHLMNWVTTDWEKGPQGLVYFAPESMIAEDGRRVMWTWLITEVMPSAIQALPRTIELPEDGVLRMKPIKELESLRYDEIIFKDVEVTKGYDLKLGAIKGDALEVELKFEAPLPEEFGVSLLADESGEDGIKISYGAGRDSITIENINPPFTMKENEDLILRIFIDKNLVEVFMNERQAAALAHDHIRQNPNISISTKDDALNIKSIRAWKMKSIYQ